MPLESALAMGIKRAAKVPIVRPLERTNRAKEVAELGAGRAARERYSERCFATLSLSSGVVKSLPSIIVIRQPVHGLNTDHVIRVDIGIVRRSFDEYKFGQGLLSSRLHGIKGKISVHNPPSLAGSTNSNHRRKPTIPLREDQKLLQPERCGKP